MFRGISKFIQSKRAKRKFRVKGTDAAQCNRVGRNSPRRVTAVDLWQSRFRFKETPAAREGYARRLKRERAKLRAKRKYWFL